MTTDIDEFFVIDHSIAIQVAILFHIALEAPMLVSGRSMNEQVLQNQDS